MQQRQMLVLVLSRVCHVLVHVVEREVVLRILVCLSWFSVCGRDDEEEMKKKMIMGHQEASCGCVCRKTKVQELPCFREFAIARRKNSFGSNVGRGGDEELQYVPPNSDPNEW